MKDIKRALITGITGQDGSYLAELLLSKGYEVHGIIRRASSFNTGRIDHIYARLFLHYGDLSDSEQVANVIFNIKPDEVYHLGAQSHVRVSFDTPEYSGNITALGTTRVLEAIRMSGKQIRFYQASSSEMFGSSPPPQNEETPLKPRSPYACAKVYAYWMTRNYRDAYDMFACNGIFFNHESPRREETFVTRKITKGITRILAGKDECIYLGNLEAKRDWGYAPEFVEMMLKILQNDKPEEFVVGTGVVHSVREFLEEVFSYVELDLEKHVRIDPKYLRPTEPANLIADPTKASEKLNWNPRVRFGDLVKIMIDAEMRMANMQSLGEGDRIIREKFPNKWWNLD